MNKSTQHNRGVVPCITRYTGMTLAHLGKAKDLDHKLMLNNVDGRRLKNYQAAVVRGLGAVQEDGKRGTELFVRRDENSPWRTLGGALADHHFKGMDTTGMSWSAETTNDFRNVLTTEWNLEAPKGRILRPETCGLVSPYRTGDRWCSKNRLRMARPDGTVDTVTIPGTTGATREESLQANINIMEQYLRAIWGFENLAAYRAYMTEASNV